MGMRADLQAIIVRYGHDRHCLVQILREAQDLDGWLAPANRTSGGRPPGRSTVSRADSIDVVREPQR